MLGPFPRSLHVWVSTVRAQCEPHRMRSAHLRLLLQSALALCDSRSLVKSTTTSVRFS